MGTANTSTKLTAEDLLKRIGLADQSAMDTLYRQQQRSVYAFALQFVSNPHDAEDVVVETFLEVWRHAARFAGQSKATTWILGIARHKALDKVRAREHVLLGSDEWDAIAETTPSNEETAADKLSRGEEAALVRECLERLPAEQRECMHLVFFHDMGLAEVASLQGVPENTVKTRLFHARRKLREWLGGNDAIRGMNYAADGRGYATQAA
jgi:RNA polymerase sigma-70 factor (ECF subfamily)